MKLNKTLALAALIAGSLLAGSTLQAQDATNTPPAGAPPGGMHARPDFAKELNLTEDQKPKFKEIMQGRMEKMKELRADTTASAEDKKAKGKAIQEDTTKQLKALLTDEQFAKWQKMGQGMHRPPAGAPGGAAPATPPQQ